MKRLVVIGIAAFAIVGYASYLHRVDEPTSIAPCPRGLVATVVASGHDEHGVLSVLYACEARK